MAGPDIEQRLRSLEAGVLANEKMIEEVSTAFEYLFRELLVELQAKGVLDEWEIAKTVLRTEAAVDLARQIRKEDNPQEALISASLPETDYFEILSAALDHRLCLTPSLYALRREIEKWQRKGMKGPDPREASPHTPVDD